MDPDRKRNVVRIVGAAMLLGFAVLMAWMHKTLVALDKHHGKVGSGRVQVHAASAGDAARALLGGGADVVSSADLDGDGHTETLAAVPASARGDLRHVERVAVLTGLGEGDFAVLFDSRDLDRAATKWRARALTLRVIELQPNTGPERWLVVWDAPRKRYAHGRDESR